MTQYQIQRLSIGEYARMMQGRDFPIYFDPDWVAISTQGHPLLLSCQKQGNSLAIFVARYQGGQILLPHCSQYAGVLFLGDSLRALEQQRICSAILQALPPHTYIYMQMPPNLQDWLPFRWQGFDQSTRYNYLWDIRWLRSQENLLSSFSRNLRRSYILAERSGLSFHQDTQQIEALLGLLERRAKEKGFPTYPAILRELYQRFAERGQAQIIRLTTPRGESVALAMVIEHQGRAIFLAEAYDKELSDNQLLKVLLIGKYAITAPEHIQSIDFEGSMEQSINELILRLGGTPEPYFALRRGNPRHWKYIYYRITQLLTQ